MQDGQGVNLHGMVASNVHVATRKQTAKFGSSAMGTWTLLLTLIVSNEAKDQEKEKSSLLVELQDLFILVCYFILDPSSIATYQTTWL